MKTTNTIKLSVLTVGSRNIVGRTEPLEVASPCSFSNAAGNLRQIKDYEELKETARAGGVAFKKALASASGDTRAS